MANQPEDFKIDLQLFAEEGADVGGIPADSADSDPFDNLSSIDSEDELELGEDEEEEITEPEGTPAEGEDDFIEIVYNQETIKIPKSEQQALLQKGYNYDKIHGKFNETQNALRARDQEVSRRFGNLKSEEFPNGIHTWDDLVKGWDNANKAKADQEIKAIDDEAARVAAQMQAEGYSPFEIQREMRSFALMKQNVQLSQRLSQNDAALSNNRAQQDNGRLAEEGTKLILGEYTDLKSKYGDLLPELSGSNPGEQLANLFNGLDEETRQDMLSGIPLKKAFLANNHDRILKHQQEMTEKRTVANVADRAKKGTETNNNDTKEAPKLSKRQEYLAKVFGVPASEVAKRTKQK